MPDHYRPKATTMRAMPTLILSRQEGERPNISFSDAPATNGEAVAEEATTTTPQGAEGETAPASSNGFWIMLLGLFLFMYLFVIRPESKRQKKRKEFQTSLSKGDAVVTAGGLHGTIAAIDEQTVTLKVADSVRMKFDRVAVSRTASSPVEEDPKANR